MAAPRPNSEPRIAILIPAYNEEPVIAGTVRSLLQADAEKKDIYVVDDRSTDRTAEIARSVGVNVYTVPKNGGKAAAQRAALKHFDLLNRYDWVIFMDGDTQVHPFFINAMFARANEDPSVALYLGRVESAHNNHAFSAMRAVEYTYGQDIAKRGQNNFGCVFVAPGCASMYRTDVLAKLNIDSTTLAEDMDLTIQVHRMGEKVKYVDEAKVITQDPRTTKDYHKQILRWYRGFWQVARKHQIFSPFKKKQRVDLYMAFMAMDALLFNPILWAVVISISIFFPPIAIAGVALHFVLTVVLALYTSYRTGRKDVITLSPIYFFYTYINLYAFPRAFIEIILLRRDILDWNKVKRYEFDSQPAVKP